MEGGGGLGRGKGGLVSALWHLEIANGLATGERRRDLIGADVDDALATIQATAGQAIDTEMSFSPVGEALANARSFQLTAYDAVYLELARREGIAGGTLGKRLRGAASKAGVSGLRV